MTEETFELIDTQEAWSVCLSHLRQASRIAVDVEADSLYSYREKVCLIQISTDTRDYIIDPLAGFSLDALGALLADPHVEKVFHAADYDLILLHGLRGWNINNLFDTMWAGRLLGFTKMGLAWFLSTLYDINLSKQHQKADWSQRPLPQALLAYARNDTHYLLRMRDDLEDRLREAGLEAEAREIFADLCQVVLPNRCFDPDDFWKIKGIRTMTPRAQAVLESLFLFRDREALRRDVPPFKVLNNQVMIQLANEAARWDGAPPKAIVSMPGVSDKLIERLNPQLQHAIKRGLQAPPPQRRVQVRSESPGYWPRHDALMTWRKDAAQTRGVESDVILGRRTLEEIAEKNPCTLADLKQIATLGPWRRKRYGRAIMEALKK